jgi:hypothetical protein
MGRLWLMNVEKCITFIGIYSAPGPPITLILIYVYSLTFRTPRTYPYTFIALHDNPDFTPFNSFLFIKNKRQFISLEGFSALEKDHMLCSQRAMLPLQSGVTALCR